MRPNDSPFDNENPLPLNADQLGPTFAQLQSNRKPILLNAIEVLGISQSEQAILPLFETAVRRPLDIEVETHVIQALLRIGEPAVAPLLEILSFGGEITRLKAIRVLGHFGGEAVRGPLAQTLHDPSERIRLAALQAVGHFSPHEALPFLIEALQQGSIEMRAEAAKRLAALTLQSGSALTALMAAVRDPDPTVRRHVVRALGLYEEIHVAPVLLEAMRDASPWVRAEAAETLGNRHESYAIPLLLDAQMDENGVVREAAARAITRFGDRRAVSLALLHNAFLPVPDKLRALEALSTFCFQSRELEVDYRFASVADYCRSLQAERLSPEAQQALEAIQAELQARLNRQQLLRGSQADPVERGKELLRPHGGGNLSQPQEMLRASDTPPQEKPANSSWLARLRNRRS